MSSESLKFRFPFSTSLLKLLMILFFFFFQANTVIFENFSQSSDFRKFLRIFQADSWFLNFLSYWRQAYIIFLQIGISKKYNKCFLKPHYLRVVKASFSTEFCNIRMQRLFFVNDISIKLGEGKIWKQKHSHIKILKILQLLFFYNIKNIAVL